jgi:hypothetical protein
MIHFINSITYMGFTSWVSMTKILGASPFTVLAYSASFNHFKGLLVTIFFVKASIKLPQYQLGFRILEIPWRS